MKVKATASRSRLNPPPRQPKDTAKTDETVETAADTKEAQA